MIPFLTHYYSVTPVILSRQFLNIRGAAVAASASRDYNLTPSVPSWPSIIVFGDYGDGPRPHFQAFWSDSETYAADENDFDLTTDSWQTVSVSCAVRDSGLTELRFCSSIASEEYILPLVLCSLYPQIVL